MHAGYKHFPPFLTMFSKGIFYRVVKSCDCVLKGKLSTDDKIFDYVKQKAFAEGKQWDLIVLRIVFSHILVYLHFFPFGLV